MSRFNVEFPSKGLNDKMNVQHADYPEIGDIWESPDYAEHSFCVVFKSDSVIGITSTKEVSSLLFSLDLENLTMYTIEGWNSMIPVLVEQHGYTWIINAIIDDEQSKTIQSYIEKEFDVDSSSTKTESENTEEKEEVYEKIEVEDIPDLCYFCGRESRLVFAKTNFCARCAGKVFFLPL